MHRALARLQDRLSEGPGQRRKTFTEYVAKAMPQYEWGLPHRIIGDVLQRVADTLQPGGWEWEGPGTPNYRRVMIHTPPQHGKSTTLRLWGGYFLDLYPHEFIGGASHTIQLAYRNSRYTRRFFRAVNPLLGDTKAVAEWETGLGGGMWVGTPSTGVTGNPMGCGIVDDPLRGVKDAFSVTVRESQKDWWRGDYYTRQRPGASVPLVLIMTRWNEDDLAGWLREQEYGEQPEHWHVVNLPAIREADVKLPPTCTLEPDPRQPGEALWEERWPLWKLERRKARLGEYLWEALYQQRPLEETGKGRICGNFSEDQNVTVMAEDDGTSPVVVGWDFNVDPMCLLLGIRTPHDIRYFDELVIPDATTRQACEELLERFPRGTRQLRAFPDPRAGRSTVAADQATHSDHAIIRSYGIRVVLPPKPPDRKTRYLCMNEAMTGKGSGRPSVFFHPRCRHSIAAMKKYSYKPGTSIPDKGTWDHPYDAASYPVVVEFPIHADRVISSTPLHEVLP